MQRAPGSPASRTCPAEPFADALSPPPPRAPLRESESVSAPPVLRRGIPFQFVSVADYAPYGLRADAFREIGGLDEGFASEGECGIFSDYELSLRLWTSGWQVGQLKLERGFESNVQGASHIDPIAGGRCWGVQAQLAGDALKARYDAEDCRAIFEQVKGLNGGLEKRFEGPALWEKCCQPTPEHAPCSLCGEKMGNDAGGEWWRKEEGGAGGAAASDGSTRPPVVARRLRGAAQP